MTTRTYLHRCAECGEFESVKMRDADCPKCCKPAKRVFASQPLYHPTNSANTPNC